MNSEALLANTDGQSLIHHLRSVALISFGLAEKAGMDKMFCYSAFYAGILHDIGKSLGSFQGWIAKSQRIKFEFEIEEFGKKTCQHPYHHEVSWLWIKQRDALKKFSGLHSLLIENTVYYHHAQSVYRYEKGHKSITESNQDIIARLGSGYNRALIAMDDLVDKITRGLGIQDKIQIDKEHEFYEIQNIPSYFPSRTYASITDQIDRSATLSLLRSSVIIADRLVSSLDPKKCEAISQSYTLATVSEQSARFASELIGERKRHSMSDASAFDAAAKLAAKGTRFEDPTNMQISTAIEASQHLTAVISAGAGGGKSRIGLHYIAQCLKEHPNRQVFWVTPRNSIAFALGKQLPAELEAILGRHKVSVETYVTGQRKADSGCNHRGITDLSSDIVVTNIDTILNPYVKHNLANQIYQFSDAIMVFDEPHELVSKEPLFFAFLQFIYARRKYTKAPSLLLTATPLPFHEFWDHTEKPTHIIDHKRIPHWNKTPLRMNLKEGAEELSDSTAGFTVTNSVFEALKLKCQYQDKEFVHGRFHDIDTEKLTNRLLTNYGKQAWSSQPPTSSVAASLIIQSAFDISTYKIVTSCLSPIKDFQVSGRVNRFDEQKSSELTIVNAFSGERKSRNESRLVDILFDRKLAKAWWETLVKHIQTGELYTRDQLCDIYQLFFQEYKEETLEWLTKFAMESFEKANQLTPKRFPFLSKRPNALGVERPRVSGGNMRSCDGSYLVSAYVFRWDPQEDTIVPAKNLLKGETLMTCEKRDAREVARYMSMRSMFIHNIEDTLNIKYGFQYRKMDPSKKCEDDLLRRSRSPESPLLYLFDAESIKAGHSEALKQRVYLQEFGLMKISDLCKLGILKPEKLPKQRR